MVNKNKLGLETHLRLWWLHLHLAGDSFGLLKREDNTLFGGALEDSFYRTSIGVLLLIVSVCCASVSQCLPVQMRPPVGQVSRNLFLLSKRVDSLS